MSDMIERVGEALAKACQEEFGSTWSNDVRWKFARAAIEAMRSPTDAMDRAGLRENTLQGATIWATPAWQSMIDVALASPEMEK